MSDEVKVKQLDLDAPITSADESTPVTVADFKRWRKLVMANLNGILQGFQQDIVGGQTRLNLVWNATNAIIRAFTNKQTIVEIKFTDTPLGKAAEITRKPLLTEDDIRKAGEQLMREARTNVDTVKKAVSEGRMTIPGETIETPLDMAQRVMPSAKKPKEEGEGN
jgi:hypothetical protein